MTPGRTRGWIWFFLFLAVFAVIWYTILIVFNLRQQLKPEQLAAARALWDEKGPRDYDLEYTQTTTETQTFVVRVRHGQVVYAEPDARPLSQKRGYYGMPALFGFIEDFLKEDAKPGSRRTFTVGRFDPEDGHLLHYIRRVTGTSQRVEIRVQLKRPSEPALPAETSREKSSRDKTTAR